MGIRERALMLGGDLQIGNSPSGGGRLSVRLPLRAAAPADRPARTPGEPPAAHTPRRRRAAKDKS
jgi:hypothetical protein